MANISIPHDFFKRLRQEIQENVPKSVRELIRDQIIVVQYEKGVRGKKGRDVVMDLAQVLPGIEPLAYVWKLSTSRRPPLRFAIFLSDFDEIPLARLLRTHRKTLANAVLASSGENRHLTNFACRPVELDEKMAVAKLVQGHIDPFEGASVVLERDREAIDAYEAEYEEAARAYRQEQSNMASETTAQEHFTTEGTTTEDLTDGEEGWAEEGRVLVEEGIEWDGGSQVDSKEQESERSISQKRKGREAEDQANFSDSGTSQASASTSKQPPQKRQRTILDPITFEDRNQWINHILTSEETRDNPNDLLKEFLSTTGQGRKWTIRQWDNYLKDNKDYIAQQISKVTGQLVE